MNAARDSNDLPRIAAEATWVRRLAVALAHDVHGGEEIAQDALLAAARGHGIGDLRAWLAGTVRNLARLRRRADERRAEREQRVARSERVDDPALAFERLELQEALLGAVRELAEPYRSTVLLRWFEGLEPEEIARRTDTPVRTVHTRLSRALGILRESLDRRSRGDRSRWLAAWLPALSKSSTGWKWVLLMELKTKLAIAGFAAAAAFGIWCLHDSAGPSGVGATNAAGLASTAAQPAGSAGDRLEAAVDSHRVLESSGNDDRARGVPSAAPPARRIHGVVVDVGGTKLQWMELVFRPADPAPGEQELRTSSDDLGRFELEVGSPSGGLEPVSADWTVVYLLEIEAPDPPEGYVLVLGHPRTYRGIVVDPERNPIAGASVCFGPRGTDAHRKQRSRFFWPNFDVAEDPLRKSLRLSLEAARICDWNCTSTETGEFSLTAVDGVPDFVLGASAGDYESTEIAPPAGKGGVTIVLQRHEAGHPGEETHERSLNGRVIDPQGNGVGGACVRLGVQSARTESGGRRVTSDGGMEIVMNGFGQFRLQEPGTFTVAIDPRAPAPRLIALHPDWRPVILLCPSGSPGDPASWPKPLVLQFTEPAPDIQGIVVDEHGAPLAHVGVRAIDPTRWNEMLALLGEAPIERGDESDGVLGADSTESDEQGRFRLRGLTARKYRIGALDQKTLAVGFTEPVATGTHGVRIVIRAGGRCPVAGRIVDLRDAPIAGAGIWARRKVAGPEGVLKDLLESGHVQSDAAGHFELPDIGCAAEELVVQAESATPAKLVAIDPSSGRDALVIRVGRIARVQVEIPASGPQADGVGFLDARGMPLQIGMKVARGAWMGGGLSWGFRGGKTAVLVVSEEATTAVLTQGGKEVARFPIHLDPNETNVVKP